MHQPCLRPCPRHCRPRISAGFESSCRQGRHERPSIPFAIWATAPVVGWGLPSRELPCDAGPRLHWYVGLARSRLRQGRTSSRSSPPPRCSAAMKEASAQADVVVMVAAVADFRPVQAEESKIKKQAGSQAGLQLELERTEDVLASIASLPGQRTVVGFAAETDDVERYGRDKLQRKGLDMIVANDVSAEGAGFEVTTNRALLLDAGGGRHDSGLVEKDELADQIWDRVAAIRAAGSAAG